MADNSITAYGYTEITDSISKNKILKDSAGKVLSITNSAGKSLYTSAQNIQESVTAASERLVETQQQNIQNSKLSTITDLQNKIKSSQGSKKKFYENLLASITNTAESATDLLENTDGWMIKQVESLKRTSSFISDGITSATNQTTEAISGVTEGITNFQNEAIHDIQGWSASLKKTLEPIGLASALGDLTEVAKNPLGAPQFVANTATSIINKINPGFISEMDNAYKSLKLESLTHLPSKMMGSIRSLATAADAILSVPFEIMSDVYNGLMDILDAIADLIDAVVATVMNILMSIVKALIDAIIPVDELLEFFSAVSELGSFIGDIGGMVGGFTAVTNIADQMTGLASSATGLLNNPLQAIPGISQGIGSVTGAVGQVTGALRNPEQFLPASIGNQIKNLSNMSGLGFVGNLGFSVGDTLDSLSQGVFATALQKFSDKAPMLGQFLNQPTAPPSVDIQENCTDEFESPKAGPHQTAQGLPVPANTQPVFPQAKPTLDKFAPDPGKFQRNETPTVTTGPLVENARNLPQISSPANGTTYNIPGGTVTIPSSFSFNP